MSPRMLLAVAGTLAFAGCLRVPEHQHPQGFSTTYQDSLWRAEADALPIGLAARAAEEPPAARTADGHVFYPETAVAGQAIDRRTAGGTRRAHRPAVTASTPRRRF